jgi:hypothetical protein
MPFETICVAESDLIIHEGHGSITFADIRAQLENCFGATGWSRHSLWDLRDANLRKLSAEEVRTLAEQATAFATIRSGKRNAWVATSPCDFGLCRMSEFLADDAGLCLGVFLDFEAAMNWITQ